MEFLSNAMFAITDQTCDRRFCNVIGCCTLVLTVHMRDRQTDRGMSTVRAHITRGKDSWEWGWQRAASQTNKAPAAAARALVGVGHVFCVDDTKRAGFDVAYFMKGAVKTGQGRWTSSGYGWNGSRDVTVQHWLLLLLRLPEPRWGGMTASDLKGNAAFRRFKVFDLNK